MNTWVGKRGVLQSAGFGFLVLFSGKLLIELKTVSKQASWANPMGQAAIAAAQREGFPAGTVIFLDQEEGGRMLLEQELIFMPGWTEVSAAGVPARDHCSGIPAKEEGGVTVVTAEDIRQNAAGQRIVYWVANDVCPPSPGCAFRGICPKPADSGTDFAEVWQYAQSPKRQEFASGCPKNYDRDGSCYPRKSIAPSVLARGPGHGDEEFDPSRGRTRLIVPGPGPTISPRRRGVSCYVLILGRRRQDPSDYVSATGTPMVLRQPLGQQSLKNRNRLQSGGRGLAARTP